MIDDLAQQGIESRVYFPPAHRQPVFGGQPADVPVTDDLAGRILSLPIHSLLTTDEMADVAAALAVAVGRMGHHRTGTMNRAVAAGLAILLAPVLAVVAVVVRVADGRPLFFVHEREGLDGRPFGLLKFRTMRSSRPGPGSPMQLASPQSAAYSVVPAWMSCRNCGTWSAAT